MSSPLIRCALVVRDLERSRRFYEQALHLTGVYIEADLTRTITWKLFNCDEGTLSRCLILKAPAIDGQPAPDFGMIGLFEVEHGALGEAGARQDAINFGETILVFYVDDLQHCLQAVRSLGGTIVSGPETFRLPKVEAREAIVRDPDGIAINLVQASETLAWQTTYRS